MNSSETHPTYLLLLLWVQRMSFLSMKLEGWGWKRTQRALIIIMIVNYGPNSGGIFLLRRLFFSTQLLGERSSFSNISPGIIDLKSLKSGLFTVLEPSEL